MLKLNPIAKHLKIFLTTKPTELPDYLSKQLQKELDKIKNKIEKFNYQRLKDLEKPLPYSLREQVIRQKFASAIRSYTPETYAGKIVIFSTNTPRHRWSGIIDDDDRGWVNIPTEGVEVHKVSGNHIDMLAYPLVLDPAKKLQLLIESAIATSNESALTR